MKGVERIFKVHSPKIAKIEVKRHGHVRRSRIYLSARTHRQETPSCETGDVA